MWQELLDSISTVQASRTTGLVERSFSFLGSRLDCHRHRKIHVLPHVANHFSNWTIKADWYHTTSTFADLDNNFRVSIFFRYRQIMIQLSRAKASIKINYATSIWYTATFKTLAPLLICSITNAIFLQFCQLDFLISAQQHSNYSTLRACAEN